jgi:aspartate/methionine/tyrosine aminotransferase
MQLRTFKLERYFARYEFSARHLLSASDCESMSLPELLALARPETRELWERLWLGYTESSGHPLLRDEIAGLYAGTGPDHVLVASPEEAIFILMNALLEPGDEVVVSWPIYQSLEEVARACGATVVRWLLRPERESSWRLDPGELEHFITPATKLVIVNFPHNPTGYLPDRPTWEVIVDTVAARGLTLFSDEMYRWLEYDEAQRLPSACEVYDKAVTLSGLSKSFGLPGLRIGWLATRDGALLARAGGIKDYTTICSSAPSEVLGIMALQAKDRLVARNLDMVRSNLKRAEHWFATRRDAFEWLPPVAGPVAFPRLLGQTSALEFAEASIRERGVMVAPGEMFDYPGHFRVGLGRRNFAEALEAL